MLREHYSIDKLFEELLGYIPKMDADLSGKGAIMIIFRQFSDDASAQHIK